METIEERASEYAYTEWVSDLVDVAKESYTKGATEQKAIDIEKACKIYRDELQRLKTQLDESVGVPANFMSVDKSLSRIRLEMEESL